MRDVTNTQTPTKPERFVLTAATSGWTEFTADLDTLEDAQAFSALLPRSLKARATTLTSPKDGNYLNGSVRTGLVIIRCSLAPNQVTGSKNETAIKRYHATLKALSALDVPVEYRAHAANSYPTQADFEAAL
jgi:hypothetical protein